MSEEPTRCATGRLLNLTGLDILFERASGVSHIPAAACGQARSKANLGAHYHNGLVRIETLVTDNGTEFPVYEQSMMTLEVAWPDAIPDSVTTVIVTSDVARVLRGATTPPPFDVYMLHDPEMDPTTRQLITRALVRVFVHDK